MEVVDEERAVVAGESNTPAIGKICNAEGSPLYVALGVGLDEIRVVLSLSGDSAKLCGAFSEHDYRPKGMPSMRFVGAWVQDGFKRRFAHFMGDDGPTLMYHGQSAALHVRMHFDPLATVSEAIATVRGHLGTLEGLGIGTMFPVRIARFDATADVIFRSSDLYRYVHSAFASMPLSQGRKVHRVKESLYVHASAASKSKREARVYDKGRERRDKAGWDVPLERYMRIEAELVYEASKRPLLDDLTPDVARATFLDRFGEVGQGTLLLKGGIVDPLLRLLHDGQITEAQYERLYTFLDHCRMGRADELYAQKRDTYLRRMREARELELDIPGDDGRPVADLTDELNVRAMVRELSAAF